MQRDELLKCIAETGYNVGFGAKKHFATYDIVEKAPGLISFIATAMGIYGLVWEVLAGKAIAATLTVVGVVGLYIMMYDSRKGEYNAAGVELTKLFNRLRHLYRTVKSCPDADLPRHEAELRTIEGEYYPVAISKQILLADWWAHYKFFWQHQIDWIDEQKHFRLMRDKIPLSLSLAVLALAAVGLSCLVGYLHPWRG
ncbi:MAG: SLATT domain-containing protein [Sphingomonas phyllosphaerae]|uniref:SLATT domain-containing protein n=1 Tax=Sphingomonas phyllosphaerae TaxID=257003 RepID=UPI002FFB39C9